MEVTQSSAYHENSNPVLRDFPTVVLNVPSGSVISADWQEMSGIERNNF